MSKSKNYQVGRNPDWPATIYVDVLYGPDKDDILIVNKPPGMDTFQTHYHLAGYPQLRDVVQEVFPNFAHAHRIDRTTSGCHAFGTKGKNGAGSISVLKNEWMSGVTKTYLAIVSPDKHGRYPKWDEIVLTMHVQHTNGTNAPCTTTLTNMGDGVIAAELTKGGRNHQIRRALAAIGQPIIGDRLYGGAEGHRVHLHAWKWKFRDILVQAPCPADMAQWEPGGYTEPLFSIPVPPLSLRDMERLAEFRAINVGGTMGWPLPPEDPAEAKKRYGYGKISGDCNSRCVCNGSCIPDFLEVSACWCEDTEDCRKGLLPADEYCREDDFREQFGYPSNHPLYKSPA